jgi:acyl carrier protein
MPTKDKTIHEIIHYFKKQHDVEITESTALIDEGVIDSFGIQDFVEFISDKFGIEVDEDDMSEANFATIPAVISFIESKK